MADDRIGLSIRVPESVHAQLHEAAAERDVSVNWLVNRALVDFLGRLIPASEITLTMEADRG